MTNQYSSTWFETFLDAFDEAQTSHEITFLMRHLPQPHYQSILDLCCGSGRHALPLARAGYNVVGIDSNSRAIRAATKKGVVGAQFVEADVRRLPVSDGAFDAAVILWQSFGYFDHEENVGFLEQTVRKLKPSSRLVLDIYNRNFFVAHEGTTEFSRAGRRITETRTLDEKFLTTTLKYDGVDQDRFCWELFAEEEIHALLDELGFQVVVSCSGFSTENAVTEQTPRMQLVYQRK